LQEGQNWEAIMYACYNLIATTDLNGKQTMVLLMKFSMGSIRAKFEALTGMFLIKEGKQHQAIIAGMTKQIQKMNRKRKPVCYCILKWGIDDEYSCLAWKSTNDAQQCFGTKQ
jgi:transketolase N-terminal domain/subunit